jgi:uncharacterized protein (DUF2345 family)
VKDKAGSLIVLDSSGITIDSKKNVTIKAASNIELNAKSDIALKASGNLTIEGKAVKVTASGGFDVNSGALKVQ